MKKVVIFQLNKDAMYGFRDYAFIQKHVQGGLDMTKYQKTYECKRADEYTLDDAWVEFNTHHPKDYKCHSLSVSDLVMMDNKVSFVDSRGFKTLLEW